ALVSTALSLLLLAMAVRVKAEYIRSLGRSIEGRFASLRGVFASLADATTLPVVRRALRGDDAQISFTLDLIEQGKPGDSGPLAPELYGLTAHPAARIRRRAIDLLALSGNGIEAQRLRPLLLDEDAAVREAAVRALHTAGGEGGSNSAVEELFASEHTAIRTAALACLARGEMDTAAMEIARRVYAGRWAAGAADPAARLELALAAGIVQQDGEAASLVTPLLDDPDPLIASTALRSAGRLTDVAVFPRLIMALGRSATREAARDALAEQGVRAVPALSATLLDPAVDPAVRRTVPAVLSRIPSRDSVAALVRGALAAETDQLLDHRAIRALSKLRARHAWLAFEPALVNALIERQTAVTRSLLEAETALARLATCGPATAMLRRAMHEAAEERREGVFRCLGLLFPPDGMHRCYLALANGDATARANALEWLEQTTGHTRFVSLEPVLAERRRHTSRRRDVARLLEQLSADQDAWIACCSLRAAHEIDSIPQPPDAERSAAMDLLDKVFLLQRVDLLRDAKSANLALLASIAEEVDVATGTVLLRRDQAVDALHVVITGAVRLAGQGNELTADDGMAFGTWALIDEAPSVIEAVAIRQSRLLRIGRDDFYDLLSDHPELAIGLLQGLARRVRTLVA
ncbi:MAG: cyclic nucleotide-binding domain-containing protein, partial [Longimicrobiales bacterium]